MSILSDLRTLYHLAIAPAKGSSQQARLEGFYSKQAGDYDSFRKRLLHGRERMYQSIPVNSGDQWADIGGGTASNLEAINPVNLNKLSRVDVVDLSTSLLSMAKKRISQRGWENVHATEADATHWTPESKQLDIVTFSYSLSMIPDAMAALENANRLLKPGGYIGVVDFYVSHKHPPEGLTNHPWPTRTFWPTWFAMDNVFLTPEPMLFLKRHFDVRLLEESRGKIPYLPFVRAPYYTFIGQKQV